MVKSIGAGDRLRQALAAAIPMERRSVVLNVRLSETEVQALRAEAERAGIPPAALARLLITEGVAIIAEGRDA